MARVSAVALSLFCVLLFSSAAQALVHSENLYLVPADPPGAPGVNQLEITLTVFGLDYVDYAAVRGRDPVTLEIDDTVPPGTVTALTYDDTGPTMTMGNVEFTVGIVAHIVSEGLGAQMVTPVPPSAVTGGTFDASEHNFIVNQGVLHISSPGGLFAPFDMDLSVEPIFGTQAAGTGLVTLAEGTEGPYEVHVECPLDVTAEFDLEGNPVFFHMVGTIVGEIPEPSSIVLLSTALLGLGILVWRKRRA